MQDHALTVGEELVIHGLVRLAILAVEDDKVVLGITAEPNDVPGPVGRQWATPLAALAPAQPPGGSPLPNVLRPTPKEGRAR
jgi:hypothetical protein